jgi:MFS family permease
MSTRVSHPRKWAILALVLAAECMDLLDGTIVNVAAPTIRGDLDTSTSALQWVIGGYALAFAVGLITGGRLGDIWAASACSCSAPSGSWPRRSRARSRPARRC